MSEKKISRFDVYRDMFDGTWYVLETRPDGSTARHDCDSLETAVELRASLADDPALRAGREGNPPPCRLEIACGLDGTWTIVETDVTGLVIKHRGLRTFDEACDVLETMRSEDEADYGHSYSHAVLGTVLQHMAIAYSSDGRTNVRFPERMVREALRAGGVQLIRRHRQKVANQMRRRARRAGKEAR